MSKPSAAMFPSTCSIFPVAYGQDRSKARTTSYPAASATGVACAIESAPGSRVVVHDRDEYQVSHLVYFAADPGLGIFDRIVPSDGAVLRALGPAVDEVRRGAYWVAPAEEVRS